MKQEQQTVAVAAAAAESNGQHSVMALHLALRESTTITITTWSERSVRESTTTVSTATRESQ